MCGIYGSTRIYSDEIVKKKLDSMKFRGPDYSGFCNMQNAVVLGHNRLAILDLDPRSNQPFKYDNVSIVFNGEIYNYLELRESLRKNGYKFHTESDTEVVCAAYQCYGASCLSMFNGMFAFVIYDEKNKTLFGARDRLGQKPFYYYHHENIFEFASQLSPIALGSNLKISDESIGKYLCWNYIPEPNTIYTDVKKLEPGHHFTYDLETSKLDIGKYWDIDSSANKFNGSSYDDAKEELLVLLKDSVKSRMISDVPLGVFLSGGIDSSLVSALAQDQSNTPIKTFSVKFDQKKYDESKYASEVADILKTDHTTILCDYSEGLGLIQNICDYYDEPFADSSAIPSMLLAKHTRKHVTVALSGDAGDESFIGYTRYDWIRKLNKVYTIPYPLRSLMGGLMSLSPNYKHKLIADGVAKRNVGDLYIKIMSSLNDKWHKNPSFARENNYRYLLNSNKPLLERVSDFDLKMYLNGDINTKVDRATMAFSLEARAPLMDYRVVEFARSLPTEYKYHNGVKKRILKDLLYNYVPKGIFDRPKAGFGIPLEFWFRNELKDFVYDSLSPQNLKSIPYLDAEVVLEQLEEHMSNKANRKSLIWKLLVLNSWMKKNEYSS